MVSVLLPELGLHLRICGLGQFVIFYEITDFLRGGFLPIISMYLESADSWFSGNISNIEYSNFSELILIASLN